MLMDPKLRADHNALVSRAAYSMGWLEGQLKIWNEKGERRLERTEVEAFMRDIIEELRAGLEGVRRG